MVQDGLGLVEVVSVDHRALSFSGRTLAVLAAVILVGIGTFSASVAANSLSGRSRNTLKLFGALFMSPILLIFYKLYHVLLPPLFRGTASVPRQPDQPGPR